MRKLGMIAMAVALGVPGMALAQRTGTPSAGEIRRVEVNRIETRRIEARPIETRRVDTGRIDTRRIDDGRVRREIVTGSRIVDRRPVRDVDRVRRRDARDDQPGPFARRRAHQADRRADPNRRRLHEPNRRRFQDPPRRRGS